MNIEVYLNKCSPTFLVGSDMLSVFLFSHKQGKNCPLVMEVWTQLFKEDVSVDNSAQTLTPRSSPKASVQTISSSMIKNHSLVWIPAPWKCTVLWLRFNSERFNTASICQRKLRNLWKLIKASNTLIYLLRRRFTMWYFSENKINSIF